MSLETFPNMVGLTKYPFSSPSGFPTPPVTRVAPLCIPDFKSSWTLLNCISLTNGPISVVCNFGSPVVIALAADFAISNASSCRCAGTSIRVGALQDCPVFDIQPETPFATDSLNLASSIIMLGDLPPSSWLTLFTVFADAVATAIPPRVEPVNDIISISLWFDIASPTTGPYPCTIL